MRLNRNPLASYAPGVFQEFAAESAIGRAIRSADAKQRIREMDDVEPTVSRQEEMNARISDQIHRMQAEHELNIDYLMCFGVAAHQRQAFRAQIREIAQSGNKSLREAAAIVHEDGS